MVTTTALDKTGLSSKIHPFAREDLPPRGGLVFAIRRGAWCGAVAPLFAFLNLSENPALSRPYS